jgi:hypothetical protein
MAEIGHFLMFEIIIQPPMPSLFFVPAGPGGKRPTRLLGCTAPIGDQPWGIVG